MADIHGGPAAPLRTLDWQASNLGHLHVPCSGAASEPETQIWARQERRPNQTTTMYLPTASAGAAA